MSSVDLKAIESLPEDFQRKVSGLVRELRKHGLNYAERELVFGGANEACADYHHEPKGTESTLPEVLIDLDTYQAIENLIAMADHVTWDMGARGCYDPPEWMPALWEEPWFDAFKFRTSEEYRHGIIDMVNAGIGAEVGEGGELERLRVIAAYIHHTVGHCAPDMETEADWEAQKDLDRQRDREKSVEILNKRVGSEAVEAFKAATYKFFEHFDHPAAIPTGCCTDVIKQCWEERYNKPERQEAAE